MTLVIRASPSPTSLRIPPIKQDDLQRRGEGPLASPLQNLFLFNGLPCLPLPANLFLALSAHPLRPLPTPPPRDSQGGNVLLAEQNGSRDELSWRKERRSPQTAGAGLAHVGFPPLPPGFYGAKTLIKGNNPAFGEKSERSRQCGHGWGGWTIEST